MKRAALYSNAPVCPQVDEPPAREEVVASPSRFRRALSRARVLRLPMLLLAVLAVLAGVVVDRYFTVAPTVITQRDIDQAVSRSLAEHPLPAKAAEAFEAIQGSVVRVKGYNHPSPSPAVPKPPDRPYSPPADAEEEQSSIGSGVVITESGAILTNLHVVSSAGRIVVVFHDGSESEAEIRGVDLNNDLAVLQAKTLPDDLKPATLITTGDLKPGDDVVAVGFPFGFGPSVSAGVVSGLKRQFETTDGKRVLSNLIQFDAAVNPGNSGGPLVNTKGEVLGIVTAIFNPVEQRFFVGLGFAVPIENAAAAVGISPF